MCNHIRTNLPHPILVGLAFIEACDPASCYASVEALHHTVTFHAGYDAIDDMQLWAAFARAHPDIIPGMGDEGTDERARAAIRDEEVKHGIEPWVTKLPTGLMSRRAMGAL